MLNSKFRYLPQSFPKYINVFRIIQRNRSADKPSDKDTGVQSKLKLEKSKDSSLVTAFRELRKGSPLPIGVLTMILQEKKARITDMDLQKYIDTIKELTDISSAHLLKTNIIKRGEPGKVYLGFIPDEWIQFFMPKTGVTGFWTFAFTFGTFLITKEIYVLDENYYEGISMTLLCITAVKSLGPKMSKYLDEKIDEYEASCNRHRIQDMITLVDRIELEKICQWRREGELMLLDAKRENIALQLEDAFRIRQMNAYKQVKNRFDYFIQADFLFQKFRQRNMIDWVLTEVKKSLPPELKEPFFDLSIYEKIDIINKHKNTS